MPGIVARTSDIRPTRTDDGEQSGNQYDNLFHIYLPSFSRHVFAEGRTRRQALKEKAAG
jgi:hypothetical protein